MGLHSGSLFAGFVHMETPDAGASLDSWALSAADLTRELATLSGKLAQAARADTGYRALYNQSQTALHALEQLFHLPPAEVVHLALAAYQSTGALVGVSDEDRMRCALSVALSAMLSGISTVRHDKGIREFSLQEVEAGSAVLCKLCAPGSASPAQIERAIHRILRAVSNAHAS